MDMCEVIDKEVLNRIDRTFFSKYYRWELTTEEGAGATVEEELRRRLPHIAPESWQARCELGGVYLAGRPAVFGTPITTPCRLEYYEPRVPIENLDTFYPKFSPEMILFHDDDCGVVFKPAGLPTNPARDQQRYHLLGYLQEHFNAPVHTPSRPDTNVSGLVLFSLSDRMNRYLQRAYERRWIEKYYFAEVAGSPEWDKRVCRQGIERDPRHPVLRRCASELNGGESAVTLFTKLCSYTRDNDERTLLQAEPLTGRTHQIRLHCRHEGFPIVGDPFYGNRDGDQLLLTSYALRFFHPYVQKHVQFETPRRLLPHWLCGIPLPDLIERQPASISA
jgi:23S rRNA-/tRNA-specific pseudouridylate synthase